MDRQKVATINIRKKYLEGREKRSKMRGFPHSDDPEAPTEELRAWSPRAGPNDIGPMKGALRVMKPGLISNDIKPDET